MFSKRRKLTNDNQSNNFLLTLISIFELFVALMHLWIHSNSLYLPTHNDQKSDIITIYRKGWFSFVHTIGYSYFLANLQLVRLLGGEGVRCKTLVKESLFETLTSPINKQETTKKKKQEKPKKKKQQMRTFDFFF